MRIVFMDLDGNELAATRKTDGAPTQGEHVRYLRYDHENYDGGPWNMVKVLEGKVEAVRHHYEKIPGPYDPQTSAKIRHFVEVYVDQEASDE